MSELERQHEETMDISAPPGSKVRFLNRNGWDGEPESASRFLTEGSVYTVAFTDVGGWRTDIYLVEVPGRPFNSVMFADVEDGDTDE